MIKKIFYITLIVIFSAILLLFLFISPITKNMIEKHSEEWLGRKIKIEKLWINIFAGSIHIKNFKLMEKNSNKEFVGIHDFYGSISVRKLLKGEYDISPVKITKPVINIVQRGNHFNFDDLLKRFSDSTKVKPKASQEQVKYFVQHFLIDSATINYSNTLPPTSISLANLTVTCSPITYKDSVYSITSAMSLSSGGSVNSVFSMNAKSMDYNLKLNTADLNLAVLVEHLKDYMKIKSLDGLVTTDLKIAGNFNRPHDVAASGSLTVKNFSIIDTTDEKLTAFEEFNMTVDSVNTKASIYNINTVTITRPYLKFAMYSDGYNFDRILTDKTADTITAPVEQYSNIFQMMAGYVNELSKEYLISEYRINKLQVNEGRFVFTDYTLEDKFQCRLDSMNLTSNNLFSRNDRIVFTMDCRLNKSGIMNGKLSLNPNGYSDMDIYYTVKGLLVSDMNPYSKYYVATPFLDGVLTFTDSASILNGKLKSVNKLFVEKIKVGDKVKTKAAYNLPIKLAVALLKDTKGNISLDIPVEGDLKDPNYKLGKVIWGIFKNIIEKAATAPFKLLSNAFGGKEEDYKEMPFQYCQAALSEDENRVLDHLHKILKEKEEMKIEFVQMNNIKDETELLALYTAKKQYLGFTDTITTEQQNKMEELSDKDSLFTKWVDAKLGTHEELTSIQNKCINYLGKEKLETQVSGFIEQRNALVLNYFVAKGLPPSRIKMTNSTEENHALSGTVPKYVMNFYADEGNVEEAKAK